jgi:hypothetical protein
MLHSQPRQTCGHRFHDRCIVRWFQTGHHTCPLCRSVLSEDTLSDIEHDPTYTPDTPPAHGAAEAAQGGAGVAHGAAGVAHGAAGVAHGAAGVAHEGAGVAHEGAGVAHEGAGVVAGAAGVVAGAAGVVAGASLHNPILIEDDIEAVVTVVPDTPVRQLPTPRRIVFEDQDHFNTIIHNAIDQRLRLLFP